MAETGTPPLLDPFPPRSIWILGAGHFGTLAARRLSRRYPEAALLVIDHRSDKTSKIRDELHLPVRTESAVGFLVKESAADTQWIVPAVPVHVAYLYILDMLSRSGKADALPVPEDVDHQVPNPLRVSEGTLYASFATFICPDACNEPDEICTHTGLPRPGVLFERFGEIRVQGFDVVVVRSLQLAPGVGGYTGADLRRAISQIRAKRGKYLICTSCRCHGVINALDWKEEQG